ncbi:MAG: Rnase Y domain-containing protein, partial [Pirellulales bacterium]
MEINPWILVALLVAAALLAAGTIKLLDYLRRKDAESEAKSIIEKAEQDIETRRKEAELEIKELALRIKSKGEEALSKDRNKVHSRERELDKMSDALDARGSQLEKQERMVESNQRRLAEKIEDANRRNEELTKLLDMQRKTLHDVTGLNREEATQRLLEMLDRELTEQTGAIVLKHEKRIQET